MRNTLNFIEFNLKSVFFRYPKNDLKMLETYLDLSIDQAIIDANVKYSGKTTIQNEEELIDLCMFDPTIEAILLYRLERNIFISDSNNLWLSYLASLMKIRTGAEIYYSTSIGKGFNIQHGTGIVIGPRYKIGDFFTIHQGVTLGQKKSNNPNEQIVIGDNVTIFAGAKVLGSINLGSNTLVAANAVLLIDTEPDSIYAGVPARRIR